MHKAQFIPFNDVCGIVWVKFYAANGSRGDVVFSRPTYNVGISRERSVLIAIIRCEYYCGLKPRSGKPRRFRKRVYGKRHSMRFDFKTRNSIVRNNHSIVVYSFII